MEFRKFYDILEINTVNNFTYLLNLISSKNLIIKTIIFLFIAGSFDYSPKFIDLNQGDSSDLSSDQGETKILEDLAEAMNENLQVNKSGNIDFTSIM